MQKVRDGYKMTELGEIPEEWEVKELIEVADKSDRYSFTGGPFGSNLKSCHYTDSGVRVIQLQNIGDGEFNNNSFIYTSEIKANELMSCNVYCGDIIIAKMAEPVARACKIPDYERRYLMCSDGIRLSVDKIKNDVDFIMYSINSQYFRNNAIANSTGSTRLRIGLAELKKLPIVIPTLKEQQKISLILSSIDKKIEITDNLLENTKELKKGLMQRLLTKGIGHDRFKDTEIGKIPEEWEVRKLGEISILITKGTTPSTYGYEFVNEGVNFIKIENISDTGKIKINSLFKISEECNEKLSRSKIEENDILVSIAGSLGKSIIISSDIAPANTNQALAIVRLDINKYSNQYINFIFSSILLKKYVEKVSTVGAQPNLSLQQIGDFKIPIPTINEQKKIASILSSVDEKIEQYEVEKEKLKEIKKGLMQKLLTGKIRVK